MINPVTIDPNAPTLPPRGWWMEEDTPSETTTTATGDGDGGWSIRVVGT